MAEKPRTPSIAISLLPVVIRYGDLDQWVVRKITESAIIGKETKTLYCVGPTDTIIGNRPFESKASPWGSSNVMARVSGITKASVLLKPLNLIRLGSPESFTL